MLCLLEPCRSRLYTHGTTMHIQINYVYLNLATLDLTHHVNERMSRRNYFTHSFYDGFLELTVAFTLHQQLLLHCLQLHPESLQPLLLSNQLFFWRRLIVLIYNCGNDFPFPKLFFFSGVPSLSPASKM